ncbi:MAG TPA: hypothetical protein PLF27_02300 [Sedimentibacter sp.]|nr:hypothetical protein [Tissierellia bacterium]HRC80195.1 hypothetical protein [Sedimentibacter sp.]
MKFFCNAEFVRKVLIIIFLTIIIILLILGRFRTSRVKMVGENSLMTDMPMKNTLTI